MFDAQFGRTLFLLLTTCGLQSLALADDPTVPEIEAAINEGVDFEYALIQTVTNTNVLKGGATRQGDYLFLCDATLVWKHDREELIAALLDGRSGASEFPEGFAQFIREGSLAEMLEAALRRRLGDFSKGDEVMSIRMRVRLEAAGDDWIVTQLNMSPSEFTVNPLDSLKPAGE